MSPVTQAHRAKNPSPGRSSHLGLGCLSQTWGMPPRKGYDASEFLDDFDGPELDPTVWIPSLPPGVELA